MTASPIYNSQHALKEALSLASQRIPVFACRYDRTPIPYNGFYGATTDQNILNQQFSGPEAVCVGIPTGAISGYAVLDIDFKNGALPWWEQNQNLLFGSFAYKTPSGGFHIYFKCPPNLKCSTGQIAKGIDIKANGGYVVFHVANGWPVLSNVALADFPSGLVPTPNMWDTLLRSQRKQVNDDYAMSALSKAVEEVENATEGERNDTLNRAAFGIFALKNRLLINAEVKNKLIAASKVCGLPEYEAKRTIESAYKKFQDKDQVEHIKPNRRFSFIRADQLKQLIIEYLIDGILSVGSQSCWFGKTSSFKSLGALSAGLCIATGTPWYGHAVKKGVVLYICGEGQAGISKRIGAWESYR